MKSLFSIVIPLFNKEKSIARTLSSVLNQTEQEFELIIVNDGSTDRSVSIVQNLLGVNQGRIINQKNAGESAARNRGVLEARTNLIAFLDADDEWDPNFLSSIGKLMEDFPEADIFGSSYYIKNRIGTRKLPPSYYLYPKDWSGIIKDYIKVINTGYPFNSSSVVIRKKKLIQVEGFPLGVKYGADVDTWIRLSFVSLMAIINTPLSTYHRDAENRMVDLYGGSLEIYYPVRELKKRLDQGEIPKNQRRPANDYICKLNLPLAKSCLFYGYTEKAKEIILFCGNTKKYFFNKYWLLICAFIPPGILNTCINFKHNIINPIFIKNPTNRKNRQ